MKKRGMLKGVVHSKFQEKESNTLILLNIFPFLALDQHLLFTVSA